MCTRVFTTCTGGQRVVKLVVKVVVNVDSWPDEQKVKHTGAITIHKQASQCTNTNAQQCRSELHSLLVYHKPKNPFITIHNRKHTENTHMSTQPASLVCYVLNGGVGDLCLETKCGCHLVYRICLG